MSTTYFMNFCVFCKKIWRMKRTTCAYCVWGDNIEKCKLEKTAILDFDCGRGRISSRNSDHGWVRILQRCGNTATILTTQLGIPGGMGHSVCANGNQRLSGSPDTSIAGAEQGTQFNGSAIDRKLLLAIVLF